MALLAILGILGYLAFSGPSEPPSDTAVSVAKDGHSAVANGGTEATTVEVPAKLTLSAEQLKIRTGDAWSYRISSADQSIDGKTLRVAFTGRTKEALRFSVQLADGKSEEVEIEGSKLDWLRPFRSEGRFSIETIDIYYPSSVTRGESGYQRKRATVTRTVCDAFGQVLSQSVSGSVYYYRLAPIVCRVPAGQFVCAEVTRHNVPTDAKASVLYISPRTPLTIKCSQYPDDKKRAVLFELAACSGTYVAGAEQGVAALKAASANALKENAAKAAPVIRRLEAALAAKDKFSAEALLGQVKGLVPTNPRMGALEKKVKGLPWPKRGSLDVAKGVKLELVLIPAGTFTMGSPKTEKGRYNDEGPQHEVTISPGAPGFYMGLTEVTQEQYEAIVGKNPAKFKGAKNPVETVSWNDAVAFCKALSKKTGKMVRLPTEAEWEYACRAGTKTAFCFGDDEKQLGDYAWYDGNTGDETHPVGRKKPNAWGLYDMHGNVSEWCTDWKADSYANAKGVDPQGAVSGRYRVLRGGSRSSSPRFRRSAYRGGNTPDGRGYGVGFRVVVEIGSGED